MKKIFFDASVIFAALYSQTGGSHELCVFVKKKLIVGITSQTVIDEVLDNTSKLLRGAPETVWAFIAEHGFIIRSEITDEEIKSFINLVAAKDAHVIAGAVLTRCDCLVTLDQKHLNNEKTKKTLANCYIASPRELLEELLRSIS